MTASRLKAIQQSVRAVTPINKQDFGCQIEDHAVPHCSVLPQNGAATRWERDLQCFCDGPLLYINVEDLDAA
jgi:hypothetical protein